MRVLITGAKGQLGNEIIRILNIGTSALGSINQVYKHVEVAKSDIKDLDITNLDLVKNYVNNFKPDIIINTAAYTNVDGCEMDTDTAFKINALGARNVAMIAEEVGAKIVHVSTDYVFSGNGSIPYKEYDLPCPVNVYGKTKLLAEKYVQQFCSKYFIVRTAWLYGYNGRNFVKTIISAGKERGHLSVVDDQKGNPTNAEELAHHILEMCLTEEYGLYHCTSNGECSWYDFAKKIVQNAGIKCNVIPIQSEQLQRAAKRPTYSSLDNMMLRCTIGDKMRNWEDALEYFIRGLL
ncbi:MAG: dTDP-4-dehydrorhamnose reductase [Clostridia bacterium]|jgi:dTDP-4-dehydrorhamnose reductase|nr:dTDP-4-dehydrorhamnose reductase [Clostridia bacterium]